MADLKKSGKKKTPKPKKAKAVVPEILDENEIVETSEPEEVSSKALASVARDVTSSDPLVMYLNEIRKYPLLSREDELKIAKKYYDTKDPDAAQALVKANLRFVVKIATEYARFSAKMIDLIQEGNLGLMHAVKDFNPYKGNKLITYAVWWIRGYIQEYLMRQHSMVRIGTTQNQRKLFYQLQKQKDLFNQFENSEQIQLMSSKLGISKEEVEQMSQRVHGRDVSLDRPIGDNNKETLSDFQTNKNDEPIDDQLARNEMLQILGEKIEQLKPSLNERETILLEERILNDEPLTLQEIGKKYGITREAVRQAEARLLKKIKDLLPI